MAIGASEVVAVKAVASGGLGVVLATTLGNTEIMTLLIIGVISSLLSFFYDWAHSNPRVFGITQISEVLKYMLYGIAMMFIVFYTCIHNCTEYIDLPKTAWGMVATLSSGSAVGIVDFLVPTLKGLLNKFIAKVK